MGWKSKRDRIPVRGVRERIFARANWRMVREVILARVERGFEKSWRVWPPVCHATDQESVPRRVDTRRGGCHTVNYECRADSTGRRPGPRQEHREGSRAW